MVLVLPAERESVPEPFVGLIGHFWSLAIEEQFYLVWPVVILLLSRNTALWVCAAILPFSIAYRAITSYVIPELGSYTATFAHLDGLAVGSALGLLELRERRTGSSGGCPLSQRCHLPGCILYLGRIGALRPARHVLLGTFVALTYGSLHIAIRATTPWRPSFARRSCDSSDGTATGCTSCTVPLISIGVNLAGSRLGD